MSIYSLCLAYSWFFLSWMSYTGIYLLAFRRQFALKLMFSYHTGYLKLSEFWYLENPGNTCTLFLILNMKDKQSMKVFYELQYMIIQVNQGFYDFSITGTMYNTGTFIFTLFHKEHSSLHRFVELSKTVIKILLYIILHTNQWRNSLPLLSV